MDSHRGFIMKRFFEILPGALAWLTLILMVLFSRLLPTAVSIFIILFDIYWLLKTIYLSLHLRSTFGKMKANLKINWLERLRDTNATNYIRMPRIIEKELSYRLTGIFFKIHNELGRFCRERQYGDALAMELGAAGIKFNREAPILVAGQRSNVAAFIVEETMVVELKAKSFIEKEDYYQLQRYLKSSKKQLGLIVNFRQEHLKPKRVLNPDFIDDSGHSDAFVDSHRGFSWQDIYHLVILPMYREPYEVVRDSFESLVRANYPKEKLIVAIALEARAGEEAKNVATRIEREFGPHFFKFIITVHPENLPGEIPGKGSNETWSGMRVREAIIDPLGIDHAKILVSVFDIDTQVFPEYFGRLTHAFLSAPNPMRAIYQPIPLFTNNIYKAPALARVVSFSATFWQMMQQSRPERLTSFSSQAIPFRTIEEIGFWQKDIVSEDSRIFWQGYLRYHGDFRAEPLFYPVSMDANVAPTFWGTMKNIYKQQRRWGWGCENIPYMLEGFRKDPAIPARKKWYWTWNVLEGFHSWATNSLIIFALGWLPVILGGRHFNYSLLSYNLPQITRFIVSLSMIGIASSAILGVVLLPPRPKWFGKRHYLVYFFQWVFMPITLIVFGAFPGLEAQTRLMLGGKWRLGFWVTPKSRDKR
ncbi:MAG: GxxExxY protein [Candidatus Liptonbacteria bacterium]|nr:GxxExxY protein [Candidatus Liptonbacteria bacterium]